MAGKLKAIVDVVKARSVFKNLAVAMLSFKLGQDVESFSEDTPDDAQLETKLIEEAKKILKTDSLTIFGLSQEGEKSHG
jgi:AmiR/NasT family two-component response regulator